MYIICQESRKLHPNIFNHVAKTASNHHMYCMRWDVIVAGVVRPQLQRWHRTTPHTQEVKKEFVIYFGIKLNVNQDDVFHAILQTSLSPWRVHTHGPIHAVEVV
jgi:hypothetical protein